MGIFDRDTQAATLDRPKTETPKGEPAAAVPNPPPIQRASTPKDNASANTQANSAPRSKSGPALKVRWTNQQGEVISEYMQTLAPSGKAMGTFHIAKPDGWPTGQYKLEVLLNDTTAATMDFDIR